MSDWRSGDRRQISLETMHCSEFLSDADVRFLAVRPCRPSLSGFFPNPGDSIWPRIKYPA